MKWTTKQPTKAGFYWYRDEHRAVVLEVLKGLRKGFFLTWDWQQGRLDRYSIEGYRGEWYATAMRYCTCRRLVASNAFLNSARAASAD